MGGESVAVGESPADANEDATATCLDSDEEECMHDAEAFPSFNFLSSRQIPHLLYNI